MLPVLYDGWSLIYQPNSPAALHLLALLHACPSEVDPWVLLPAQPDEWLSGRAKFHVQVTPNRPRDHLGWEQRLLPRMAADLGARLLHLTTASAPLFTQQPCVLSPAEFGWPKARYAPAVFWNRAREAVSNGGMSRLRGLFWPADLPSPDSGNRVIALPPGLFTDYLGERGSGISDSPHSAKARPHLDIFSHLDLPQTFILYHGPQDDDSLQRLLNGWSWAAGPIGDYYPLLILGLSQLDRDRFERVAQSYDLRSSVRALPTIQPALVPALYQASSALFHPAPIAPWGGSLRRALILGKPVVALATLQSDALVGPAAYLVPGGDARAMGAALVTVIVEESIAESLSEAALQRAADWGQSEFDQALLTAYHTCLDSA